MFVAFAAIGALVAVVLTRKLWSPPPASAPYIDAIHTAEVRHGLPHNLLARLIDQESDFNPNARNASGATGIAQIIPRFHDVDATDPFASIDYAAGYLRQLHDQFGTWEQALAAYDWGPGNLKNAIARSGGFYIATLPTETQNYVRDIAGDVLTA